MPQISEFFGIKIFMYWNDHQPAHFHAKCEEFEAIVDVEQAIIIKGVIPARQLKLVLAWCELHREELLANWEKCRKHEQPQKIEALQ